MKKNKNSAEENSNTYDALFKIIMCGDMSVGKTCLVSKYVLGMFPSSPLPTIGSELKTKIIELEDGVNIKAQIWDTAGQEKYKSITSHHFKKALGALLVYDVTRKSTFENIKSWIQDVKSYSENCEVIIVGNKVDLTEKNPKKREVTYEEGKQFAEDNKILFRETSALMNYNVNEIFKELLERIYNTRNLKSFHMPKHNIRIETVEKSKTSTGYKCCK